MCWFADSDRALCLEVRMAHRNESALKLAIEMSLADLFSATNVSQAIGMVVDMVTLYSRCVLSCMCVEDKCAT